MQREPLEYPEYAPMLEEPNVREIKRAEGPGGAGRSGEDTQEVQVPQPPWTENPAGRRTRGVKVMLRRIPLQVGEEGIRYYFRSSSSTTEDSEGPAEDMSGSRNGEGLNDGSPGKTVRGAGHAVAGRAPGKNLGKKAGQKKRAMLSRRGTEGQERPNRRSRLKIRGRTHHTGRPQKSGIQKGRSPPRVYRTPT